MHLSNRGSCKYLSRFTNKSFVTSHRFLGGIILRNSIEKRPLVKDKIDTLIDQVKKLSQDAQKSPQVSSTD